MSALSAKTLDLAAFRQRGGKIIAAFAAGRVRLEEGCLLSRWAAFAPNLFRHRLGVPHGKTAPDNLSKQAAVGGT
jgi:hypothetical protein